MISGFGLGAHLDDPHLVGVVDDGDLLRDALPRRAREEQLCPCPLLFSLLIIIIFNIYYHIILGIIISSS